MNNGTLDRPTFEAIEAYVLDRMAPDERASFESRLSADPALRAELELERENIRAIELGGVARTLRTIAAEEARDRRDEATTTRWRFTKYAAAAALLIGVALWWVARPSANERLFAAHFVADPGLPVPMSATDDHAFHDAMVAYKLGDHQEAIDKWAPLLKADPGNDTLRFYIAAAKLAMGDAAGANPMLAEVADMEGSSFQRKAMWYLFLARVKNGETAEALAMPLDADATYGERVRAIKDQLHR